MKKSKGSIILSVVIFIFIFTLLGLFSMRIVVLQQTSSETELYQTRAHFAALYGSELALFNLMQWGSIPETPDIVEEEDGTTVINYRKFLKEDSDCFDYDGTYWYPLGKERMPLDGDSAVDTIWVSCRVSEDTTPPNINDGFIPGTSETSTSLRKRAKDYGTYRFYVIETEAEIYTELGDKRINQAKKVDRLYFFIAYSRGEETGLMTTSTSTSYPEYVRSTKSFITGQTQPVYRYYIRGRR